MSSEGMGPAAGPRLHHFFTQFDPEAAAVVTILLGLVQVLLSAPLFFIDSTMTKLFLLPLIIGALIVAGGSFTMASERFPSRKLLRGCACSNVVGLLGALLAFCLYCFTLSSIHNNEPCAPPSLNMDIHYPRYSPFMCPAEYLMTFSWCVTVLLILYDMGAVVLHCLLSVSAVRGLQAE